MCFHWSRLALAPELVCVINPTVGSQRGQQWLCWGREAAAQSVLQQKYSNSRSGERDRGKWGLWLAAIPQPGCVCAGNSPLLSQHHQPGNYGRIQKETQVLPSADFHCLALKCTNNTQQYLLPIYPLCNVISPAYGTAAVLVHVSFHYKIKPIAKTLTG